MSNSPEILELYENGKILQMKKYLNDNPEKVSPQLKQIIKEEIRYYELGQAKVNKSSKTYTGIYDDKNVKFQIRRNTDNKKGFLGYHSELILDTLPYGSKSDGKLVFGNSGIENIIPYVFEIDLIASWT